MSESRRLAAIDIGTVTTRLLVADVDADGVHEVERSTDITHLGEGLSERSALSAEALERVETVIARYATRIEALGVERYAAIATSASRDADNADELADALSRHGVAIDVVTGAREAELSFLGATAEREGVGLLVVDCGGGSTELVLGDVALEADGRVSSINAVRSIDVGSRRMTDRFFASDPPSARELDWARSWAAEELRPFFDRLDARPRQMIGLAGTATSLGSIHLGMEVYDPDAVHGLSLAGSEVSDILELLASLTLERRRQVVGLHPERAGVIVAGTLIIETTLALAGLDSMVVSEHDILYGILLDTYLHLRE